MGVLLGGTDTVNVFKSDIEVDAQLNVLPKACEIAKTGVPCNIHRGGRQAEDSALAIGMNASLGAIGFFNLDYASYLENGRVLQDQNGQCWVIRGRPAIRNRIPATAHARVLLECLIVTPNGI